MKKIIFVIVGVVILGSGAFAYRQYASYRDCKIQSHQAALFIYPDDPTHPEYAGKRDTMETNFIKNSCNKFAPNIGT